MLAKLTSKNQLTLPKAAIEAAGSPGYFQIEVRAGQLVLTPIRLQRADGVRAKLAQLDLGDDDLAAAVAWARSAAARKGPSQVAEKPAAYRSGERVVTAKKPPVAGRVAMTARPLAKTGKSAQAGKATVKPAARTSTKAVRKRPG